MKMTLISVLSVFALSTSAFAGQGGHMYQCKGKYRKDYSFALAVKGLKKVALLAGDASCKPLLDLKFNPIKYKGYVRYGLGSYKTAGTEAYKDRFARCRFLSETVMHPSQEQTAVFDSLKMPEGFAKGMDGGLVVLVYDDGDYHGQLVHEKFNCSLVRKKF